MMFSSRSPAGKSAWPRSIWLRSVSCVAVLGLLSACGSSSPRVSATQEAAQYASRARADYTPPGPPSDPWGPYIQEASKRFDVPDRWIREVMRQESGGRQYHGGRLVTSSAGAMGLMQVMPGTYDELRERYDLGSDPFDPHENILAGTAYLREMYDIYGSPGFLAAYNAGPSRLDDYLSNNRGLPDETRKYVAAIGPRLIDATPNRRSPAEQYAMNALPTSIPAGTRYGRKGAPPADSGGNFAYRIETGRPNIRLGGIPAAFPGPVQVAQLAEPARAPEPQRVVQAQTNLARAPSPAVEQVAVVVPPSRFRLIASAQAAEPVPMRRGVAAGGTTGGRWAIQVGAFGNQNLAHAALGAAKDQARDPLSVAQPSVSSVRQPKGTLYRARMVGLSRDAAVQACEKLSRRSSCIVLSPDAQS